MRGGLHVSKRVAAAALAFALLVGGRAAAADDPKAPPAPPPKAPATQPTAPPAAPAEPFQAEIDAIRKLVADGKWQAAKDAADVFFKTHENDLRVLSRLPDVEEVLRRCLFRLANPKLTPVTLLGRGCTKYDPGGRMAEFSYRSLEARDGWTFLPGGTWFFDVMFDGTMTIEYGSSAPGWVASIVAFDTESRGGYAVIPVFRLEEHTSLGLVRLDPNTDPYRIGGENSLPAAAASRIRLSLGSSQVRLEVVGRQGSVTASDRTYRKGFIAFQDLRERVKSVNAPPDVSDLKIKGRIEATFGKRTLAEAEGKLFRAWESESYDRDAVLPAWVLKAEQDSVAWRARLPFDCPATLRPSLQEVARIFFEREGNVAGAIKPLLRSLPAGTAAWLEGLAAAATGDHATTEKSARRLMELDPGFAPAHTLLGLALLGRGDAAGAAAALEEARSRDPHYAPTYDAMIDAALRAGDFAAARTALALAAEAGTATARTADMRRALFRIQRGPEWARRFEHQSEHFQVMSDASKEVCAEVARVLEDALVLYAAKFRPLDKKGRARVYVFSGEDSYLDYADDLGSSREGTLGVYVPQLRELCLFLHEDRAELWNTVRHEAFHQYLHNFIETAPHWFNEGYAEYFASARRVNGRTRVGKATETQEVLAPLLFPSFTPLRELFLMDGRTFMAKADVHYVQAWAVIHFLRSTDDPRLSKTLAAYTDALIAGKSREDAYTTVLEPVLGLIERGLAAHVRSMAPR